MSDNKKYYYLKLKDNFFDSDQMIVLESMPDGYKYSNILLKLYLRSLKNDGKLMFNDRIPYNSTILSQVTRHSVGDVEKAVKVFSELDLIEILENGAIYMLDIQNFIGESSTEGDRKRAYRRRIEQEKNLLLGEGQMSDKSPDVHPPEIEIEIELDKEIDIDKEIESKDNKPTKKTRHKYGDNQNVLMTKDEHDKLSEKFPNDLDKRINNLGYYMASTGKSYKSHYMTIIAWARRDKENTNTQNKPLDLNNVFDEKDNSDQWARLEERKNARNR